MIHPTIQELTYNGQFNRYELALATAKCARKITNEYMRQRDAAEKAATGNKDIDKPLMNMIKREYRDEKAVKIAINKIHNGEYTIVKNAPEEPEYAVPPEAETRNPFAGMSYGDEDNDPAEIASAEDTSDEIEDDADEIDSIDEDTDEEEEEGPTDEELMALEKEQTEF